ncbi:uncharacterized protein [Typha angustifolia]|uniref:uncharacterized protein n=1 Tax=Typha angustifolia TaxID=59011 RepID=UPI003C2AECE9
MANHSGSGSDAMEATDVEMDAEMAETGPLLPAVGAAPVGLQSQDDAWSLLALARQLVDEGKPSLALQAVVMATKSEGGDHAVLDTMNRARELYRQRLQANASMDQLASLFAQCAIAEARPIRSTTPQFPVVEPSVLLDANNTSILAEMGRKQIILDAFADGSSFICLQCGGLVSNSRRDEHLAYWCGHA